MLPDPIPYSESESLSLRRRFRFLVSRFLRTFSSLSNLSLNWAKDCFAGLGFFPPFLAARKSDFSVPSFSKRRQVLCVVYAPPCFLQRSRCFLVRAFLGTLGLFQYQVATYPFIAVRRFLVARSDGLVGSFLATYALGCLERQKERTYVHRSPTFLVKVGVGLILPRVRARLLA